MNITGLLKFSSHKIANILLSGIFMVLIASSFGCQKSESPKEEVKNIPIGVQLYCVRKECAEDLPGTLSQLSKIGFDGVEFADYFGYSAEELKKMLDDAGLKPCGTHIYVEDLLGEKFDETVEFNKVLGNKYLIIRFLDKEKYATKQSWVELAKVFNEISEKLKPHGMQLGYHNHGFEFETVEGEMPWDLLADNTNEDVILQIDLGNASHAGVDPIHYLKRNPGRSVTSHLKPYSAADKYAFIGEDDIDWKKATDIYEETGGIAWYIVEYEVEMEDKTPVEALKINFDNLKKVLTK